MIRTALLLGLVACSGCASPFGVRGYYRYPPGITKQCHLKVADDAVTVIVVEDRATATHPYRMRDGKIVVDDKPGSEFTPRFMKLVDHRGRKYPKVLSKARLRILKEVEDSPNNDLQLTK